jgi:hypothetical protein
LQEVFPNWVTFHALHKVLTFHCVMRICEYYWRKAVSHMFHAVFKTLHERYGSSDQSN